MQFTSIAFLCFAALVVVVYYAVPKKMQWCVLLLSSYLFYCLTDVRFVPFLLYSTAVTYITSRALQSARDKEDAYVEEHRESMDKSTRKAYRAAAKKHRFRILVAGLLLGFGMLAVIKYTAFVVSGVRDAWTLFGGESFALPNLLLPLGISFYTFQSMGYLIDVYRKKVAAEQNPFKLALFVSYFPLLVQGPISRYDALAEQLYNEHAFDATDFRAGFSRAVFGAAKKVILADTAAVAVQALVQKSGEYTGIYVFLLILLYSVQIYGNFTGGIDITIGLSRMLGIRVAENFDHPFSSRSVKEYWRRWHITMGSWFTDYVFYPLSVSSPMQKLSLWSRSKLGNALGKRLPVYTATIVTWFLTGLWHGAGWNFIVWGLLNCAVILVSQELQPLYNLFYKKCSRFSKSAFWSAFGAVRTFLLMGLFRSLDCYRNVPLTFRLWGSMFTTPNFASFFGGGWLSLGLTTADWCVISTGVIALFFLSKWEIKQKTGIWEPIAKSTAATCAFVCGMAFLILIFGAYGIGYDVRDFIYSQF